MELLWSMELLWPAFLTAALIGVPLIALVFWLTRNSSEDKRIAVRSFVLAATVTPSVVLHHTSLIVPAITVLVVSPSMPIYGWSYALLFGALPICFVWAAIVVIWYMARFWNPPPRANSELAANDH